MLYDCGAKACTMSSVLPERFYVDDRAGARNLYDGPGDRDPASQRGLPSDHAFLADHCGFDHFARRQLNNQGDDAGMSKSTELIVSPAVKRTFRAEEDGDSAKVRQKTVEVGLRKGGQNTVGRMRGWTAS